MSPRSQTFSKTEATVSIARSIQGPASDEEVGIAWAIDQIESFLGVGQRDDQGRITPDAFVADVHTLLAFSSGDRVSAIDVQNGLAETSLVGEPKPGSGPG